MASLPRSLRAHAARGRRAARPHLETLEPREVPSTAGLMGPPPAVLMAPAITPPSLQPGPQLPFRPQGQAQPAPWALSPSQIRAAYGFDQVMIGGAKGDGTGQTIAIVAAYDNPRLVSSSSPGFSTSDLARFDQAYGLPDPPSFQKLNQYGQATGLPGVDPAGPGSSTNWEREEALDVEWAHALAPGASIVLIECASNNGADLYRGAVTAAALPGVSVVSMSWGCPEFNGESAFDVDFQTPAGHQGVTFVAAAGDDGAPGLYPAFSPNVLAVGGTRLTVSSGGAYGGETAWSKTGGGTSASEPEPAYQKAVQSTGMRTVPDVAFDADPGTGVSVYDSYSDATGAAPWTEVGGTSLGAPSWSALIAIANQARAAAHAGTLDGPTQTLPMLYSLGASGFHDVTTGGNGAFSAAPGYDEVSGLGSPIASAVVAGLSSRDIAPRLAVTAVPSGGVMAGAAFGLTVTVQNQDGTIDTGYSGVVTLALGSDPGGDVLGGTLSAAVSGGTAVFSGLMLTRAASGYTIVASASGASGAASSPFSVVAAAPVNLVLNSAPAANGHVGLTVAVVDAYGNITTNYGGTITVGMGKRPRRHQKFARRHGVSARANHGVATFHHLKIRPRARALPLWAAADDLADTAVFNVALPSAHAGPEARRGRALFAARTAHGHPAHPRPRPHR